MAAFRMKQRGLVLHEKLDKAAVSALGTTATLFYFPSCRLVCLAVWIMAAVSGWAAPTAQQQAGSRCGVPHSSV